MLAMSFLQEAPNTSLAWLFYVLLAFLALVIIAGAIAGHEKTEPASRPEREAQESAPKPKAPAKTKRSTLRRKSR